MKFTRRQMMLTGLSLLAAGCTPSTPIYSRRPGTPWPSQVGQPTRAGAGSVVVPRTPTPTPVVSSASPPGTMPRSWWTRAMPVRSRVNPMNGVNRITVHHEGNKTVWFTDVATTRAYIDKIRTVHTRDRRWADIGYHFIIDRGGRIIEGRPIQYQGAHVSKQNEHNVGVMLLGNFEQQMPSQAQLTSLQTTLRHLMAHYKVPVRRVYTHRELGPTVCPGRNLQPRVAGLRTSGALA